MPNVRNLILAASGLKQTSFSVSSHFLCLMICTAMCSATFGQTPQVWTDFVTSQANGTQPILPDYSYSGYAFSEEEIPDVSSYLKFDVTDYGAIANDGMYDDATIQATIDAAVASGVPALVYFPAGRYMVSSDNDLNKFIHIYGDNIILKGEGSGVGGTEIFMDKMRVDNGHWQFKFSPASTNTSTLTSLTAPALRGDFTVEVESAAGLSLGQSIFINHQSEEFAMAHYGNLLLNDREWTRLFGTDGGLIVFECHIIDRIEGNRVTFKNPVQIDLPTLSEPFTIRNLRTIEGVGIEDIRFTSGWLDHPEDFVHHANDIVDYGWNAVQFKLVQNSWIRNCEFKDWTQVADIRESIGVTVDSVLISGKRGHTSWSTRRNYGVLVKDCVDEANHHHGPGMGYSGVSTVYLRYKMNTDQSIDSHSGSPYVSLFDDVDGGDFHTNGGPWASYPHHARHLTFWNFRHNASDPIYYNFWSVYNRQSATYAEPFFVGLQTSDEVTFTGEGLDEMRDITVEPRSLFEAQLDLRLNAVTSTKVPQQEQSVQIFPNPFTNAIQVVLDAESEPTSIEMYSIDNQRIASTYSENASGYTVLAPEDLPTGVYLLRMIFDGKVITQKLVKE